jgi:thiol-disulfide isomerase/thioredoxin
MFSCKNETKVVVNNSLVTEVQDIDLEVDDFNGLQKYLNTTSDKTYVVNFWATWCSPCIKELPFFEELNKNYSSKNVEVILVSLDFPNKYETSLKPFIKEKNLQSKVVALNDTDSNTWIPKVSEDWSGAIPATLIFNK